MSILIWNTGTMEFASLRLLETLVRIVSVGWGQSLLKWHRQQWGKWQLCWGVSLPRGASEMRCGLRESQRSFWKNRYTWRSQILNLNPKFLRFILLSFPHTAAHQYRWVSQDSCYLPLFQHGDFRGRHLTQQLRRCLGWSYPTSGCLGSSPGSTFNSSFLLRHTLGGSRLMAESIQIPITHLREED